MPRIYGNQAIQWGAGGLVTGMGIVQGGDVDETGQDLEVADEDGETEAYIQFNDKDEASIEVVITTGSVPSRGDLVSGAGLVNAIVKGFKKTYKNNDVARGTLTMTKFSKF